MLTHEKLVAMLKQGNHRCQADTWTDEAGFAYLVGIAERTARDYREQGISPPWYKLNRVMYEIDDILTWINDRRSAIEK
jgi:hypothetical protein